MRYRRRSARGSSGTLLVTFVLGFGLGFSLCYAMVEVLGRREAGMPPPPAAETVSPAPEGPGPAANTGALHPAPPGMPPDAQAADTPAEAAPPPTWPARHVIVGVPGHVLAPETRALLRDFAPGGFLLTGESPGSADEVRALTDTLRAIAAEFDEPRGVIVAVAHEGGAVNPLGLDPAPAPRDLASSGPPADARAQARVWGEEIRGRGIGVVLGPALGVHRPDRGEPALEAGAFAESAEEVAAYGLAVMDGLRDGGVHPVVTGYPGVTLAEPRDGMLVIPDTDLDELALFMAPFLEALDHGAPGILVEHVAVPAIEGKDAAVPAPFSYRLVHLLLRERVGYGGLVVAAALPDAEAPAAQARAVVTALAAGCDAVILRDPTREVLRAVCAAVDEAVAEGVLDPVALDAAAARLARLADAPEPALTLEPEPVPDTPPADPAGAMFLEHTVVQGDTLSRVAGQYGVSMRDLREWNGLTRDDVIKLGEKLVVRVPAPPEEAAPPEPATQDADADAPEPPAAAPPAPEPSAAAGAGPAVSPPRDAGEKAVVFGRGDSLQAIAERYGVTPEEIRAWNELGPGEPAPGEVLHLFVPQPAPESPPPTSAPAADPAEYDTYVVQPGDTLHRIAVRHGATVQDLMRINNIQRADLVQLGRRLKVPKQAAAE